MVSRGGGQNQITKNHPAMLKTLHHYNEHLRKSTNVEDGLCSQFGDLSPGLWIWAACPG